MAAETAEKPRRKAASTGKVRLQSLDDLDQRTNAARRVRALVEGIEADLGGGSHLSVAKQQLAQRAALLSAVLEHQEAVWLERGEIDLENYTRTLNALARVLGLIGLERKARPTDEPRLADVLNGGEAT